MSTPLQIQSVLPYPTRKPDPITRPKPSSPPWWTPLFGWSAEPDYIGKTGSEPEPEIGTGSRIRVGSGVFTEEKAKELRRKTRETSCFHDVMYHSAIASRLASHVTD